MTGSSFRPRGRENPQCQAARFTGAASKVEAAGHVATLEQISGLVPVVRRKTTEHEISLQRRLRAVCYSRELVLSDQAVGEGRNARVSEVDRAKVSSSSRNAGRLPWIVA